MKAQRTTLTGSGARGQTGCSLSLLPVTEFTYEDAMKTIEIYTKDYCPYCHRAKELLIQKGHIFVEYDVTNDTSKEQEMRQRSGRSTVPEIFVDGELIGGCDDLFALEKSGRLDERLG
jgi:glutaredoxin 3